MNDPTLVVDRSTAADIAVRPKNEPGLPWPTMEKWLGDLRNQPAWRSLADKCADYYDGNQLTADQLAAMEASGMAPIIANIVRPTVDVVLGMEAKTRQDWRVVADAAEFQDVAEAESAKLAEAERESKADRACSDAYAGQIKAGLHWVEVNRSMDPFNYPYRCQAIHRREIWWDWRAKQPDLSDARFLLRRRWVDLDELLAIFPQHSDVLEQVGNQRGYPIEKTAEMDQSRERRRGFDVLVPGLQRLAHDQDEGRHRLGLERTRRSSDLHAFGAGDDRPLCQW